MAFHLACLEIRSTNEEAINSIRDRTYSLRVCYFLLYRRRYFLFVSDLVRVLATTGNNVCTRRLYACIKKRKIKVPRFHRNFFIARDQNIDLHGTSFQSSPKINRMLITRPFAYNKRLQHPTIAVLPIKILLFFFRRLSSVPLFQSNQRSQAIEFVNRHVSE